MGNIEGRLGVKSEGKLEGLFDRNLKGNLEGKLVGKLVGNSLFQNDNGFSKFNDILAQHAT